MIYPDYSIVTDGKNFRVFFGGLPVKDDRVFATNKEARAHAEFLYGGKLPWRDLPLPTPTPTCRVGYKRHFRKFPYGQLERDDMLEFLRDPEQWKLPRKLVGAVLLRFQHNLTYKEIGRRLKCSVKTAQNLISKALYHLKFQWIKRWRDSFSWLAKAELKMPL